MGGGVRRGRAEAEEGGGEALEEGARRGDKDQPRRKACRPPQPLRRGDRGGERARRLPERAVKGRVVHEEHGVQGSVGAGRRGKGEESGCEEWARGFAREAVVAFEGEVREDGLGVRSHRERQGRLHSVEEARLFGEI